jgi:hypothetical protein
MGTSDPPRRSKLLAWLAGFVVVFGALSWLVTSGIRPHVTPPKPTHPANITPGPTPTPLVCASNELTLTGVFNECATAIPEKNSICSVAGDTLEVRLQFAGISQTFLFYVEVKATYTGPGMYYLPQWQFRLGTNDVPKVAVRELPAGTLWQSVEGALYVAGGDGRSGTVNAILQASTGSADLSGPTLSVIGPWSCH